MRELNTIQKREKLNTVMAVDTQGNGGANHRYVVETLDGIDTTIQFQNGPRNEDGSTSGVIDTDLLEIVRDRLICFQHGPFASYYNEQALVHVEEALMWLNRRTEERLERGILGTNNK